MSKDEVRHGVELTNLDQQLFDGAAATKRDLVDYLDAVSERMIVALQDRPLSVIRVLRGQAPFMQKNLPKYTPAWVVRVPLWAESSKREVSYALCNDRKTLLWFANQRAVEYHPTLFRIDEWDQPTYLVLDIDPPNVDAFRLAVQATLLVRQALADAGLAGAVKTSGAKGLHVFVPVASATTEDVAAATRAIVAQAERLDPTLATTAFVREERSGKVFLDSTRAGGATVVAGIQSTGTARSTRVLPSGLGRARAHRSTRLHDPNCVAHALPTGSMERTHASAATLAPDLVAEGRLIPIARVQAMHEGLRRARARRHDQPDGDATDTSPR